MARMRGRIEDLDEFHREANSGDIRRLHDEFRRITDELVTHATTNKDVSKDVIDSINELDETLLHAFNDGVREHIPDVLDAANAVKDAAEEHC